MAYRGDQSNELSVLDGDNGSVPPQDWLCNYSTVRGEILEGYNIGKFGELQVIRQNFTYQNFIVGMARLFVVKFNQIPLTNPVGYGTWLTAMVPLVTTSNGLVSHGHADPRTSLH